MYSVNKLCHSVLTPVLLILALMGLSGCGDDTKKPQRELTVLAGSELKDMAPSLQRLAEETGIHLNMEYIGTLDGIEQIIAGKQYDLAWFSHAKYLSMLPGIKEKIHSREKIMLSPVIIGIKEKKAREWGWFDNPDVRWSDIADKAAVGELAFGMTNPTASNSGFTALLGVAAAFSKTGTILSADEVDKQRLIDFFKGQKLTSGSSGWLAETYQRQQDTLDGLINYESVLMSMNDAGGLQEKLHLIYPREGIVTADYPMLLLNKDKLETFKTLTGWLKGKENQQWIMDNTRRRPVIPQVRPSSSFNSRMLIELPFPADRAAVETLLFTYLDEVQTISSPFFVLDISGSMAEENRLEDLRTALNNLTGLDTSLTGRFSRFRKREEVHFYPFNNRQYNLYSVTIDEEGSEGQAMQDLRTYFNVLKAGGGTAIYDTLIKTYRMAGEKKRIKPDRYYSIVLLTDGKNTNGADYAAFERFYHRLPEESKSIKTFAILFGNASNEEMNKLAALTGGRVFDGRSHSLAFVFKKIRGYQ